MEKNWLPWIIVGGIVILYIWGREQQGSGGGSGMFGFIGTPSNPTNTPSSGCSFCGVGTIAPGAPSAKGTCSATPIPVVNPPCHVVFPVCHGTCGGGGRVSGPVPIIPICARPKPIGAGPGVTTRIPIYGMPHYGHCLGPRVL